MYVYVKAVDKNVSAYVEGLYHPCGAFWNFVGMLLFFSVVMLEYLYITVFYYKFLLFLSIIVSYAIIFFEDIFYR